MALAIFDLDNTLLGGDSDNLWGEFLVARGIVDGHWYAEENRRHYAAYEAGTLDIDAFLAFALAPLAAHDPVQLRQWREEFIAQYIQPIMLPAATALLNTHRQRGDQLLIITATNSFITAPIARLLGIDNLLATEPEQRDGRYTGRVAGTPCFQEGKVERLTQWLEGREQSLAESIFYSDSHNDLPLLNRTSRAVAVDPDTRLAAVANEQNWPVVTLRQGDHPRLLDSGASWQP